jgi:hypothetical protein
MWLSFRVHHCRATGWVRNQPTLKVGNSAYPLQRIDLFRGTISSHLQIAHGGMDWGEGIVHFARKKRGYSQTGTWAVAITGSGLIPRSVRRAFRSWRIGPSLRRRAITPLR